MSFIIKAVLRNGDKVDSAELEGSSVECFAQIFWLPRGRWTEFSCYLGTMEAVGGFIFTKILDICWQLFFWIVWVVIVLGE